MTDHFKPVDVGKVGRRMPPTHQRAKSSTIITLRKYLTKKKLAEQRKSKHPNHLAAVGRCCVTRVRTDNGIIKKKPF